MVLNTICLSIAMGLNGALDTLVSQAFGNGQYRMCGVYMNRARVVNAAFFVPMCVVLLLTEEILIAFGQDQETSSYAETYVTTLIPGVFMLLQQ